MAKLHRLLFIAERCPSLQLEALRMAMTFVMTTYNTSSYQAIHRKLTDAITRLVTSDKKIPGRLSSDIPVMGQRGWRINVRFSK